MPIYIHNNSIAATASGSLTEHYGRLGTSIERLSSGLRINSAADDAAGLAIRELMRVDVAAYYQGISNINDAISLIQTADGALSVIDEKLIRMKELAEQAATGTYDSTQRLMIDSEFQAMASEIDRIANATDFNGIKLLDGSRQGAHDGSGLEATGALKVHFGTANDSAEDYYYLEIKDCTTGGLGLRNPATASADIASVVANNGVVPVANAVDPYDAPILSDLVQSGRTDYVTRPQNTFSILSYGVIPKGTIGFSLTLIDRGDNDTVQIFKRDGTHLVGTTIDKWTKPSEQQVLPSDFMTEANGFLPNASYNDNILNGIGSNLTIDYSDPNVLEIQNFTIDGMQIGYTGDGNYERQYPLTGYSWEELTINNVEEDLIIIINGYGLVQPTFNWTYMPNTITPPGPGPDQPNPPNPPGPGTTTQTPQGDLISIKTQDEAQQALTRIDDAIVAKDKVRAHLGAMQNRLENSSTNITTQAENLQAAEARISDADVAREMTLFVRSQILTQSAVAMLGQANSFPHMLSSLLMG